MDKTIWKYELTMADKQYIEMPHGAEILCVQLQNDTPFLWALVTPKLAKENRLFEIFGTGHKIPFDRYAKRNFIGTFQIQNMLVFHLFERKPINHLCKCLNCDTIMYDENPQIDAKFLDTTNLVVLEMVALEDGVGGFFWACPLCLTDSYLTDLPQN